MSDRELLFNRFSLQDVLAKNRSDITQEILGEKREYLLNVTEENYITHLVEKHAIDPLVLHRDSIEIAHQGDEFQTVEDFGRPIRVQRNFVTFSVPYSGERGLFFLQPSTFTFNPPRASIEEKEASIKIWNEHDDGARLRQSLDSILDSIAQYINWQKADIDSWNSSLRNLIEATFRQRKEKLLKEIGAVQSLGFPLRKRANMPASYSVPIAKKKIALARPPAATTPYQAPPILEEAQYNEILDILKNMVLVMERSPGAFATAGEETLRTHFLVQLNGQFEGNATGETFNFQGKTDILIRKEGKNLFVAECKFWSGAKAFHETLDQLLGYLTWRDAKVAALIFVRDVAITTVLKQIPDLLGAHPAFVKNLPNRNSGEFAAVMKSQADNAVSLTLTVQVYHIPTKDAPKA